jgi:hypothetical protein
MSLQADAVDMFESLRLGNRAIATLVGNTISGQTE